MLSLLSTVLHVFIKEPGVKSAIIHICSGSLGLRLEQQGYRDYAPFRKFEGEFVPSQLEWGAEQSSFVSSEFFDY